MKSARPALPCRHRLQRLSIAARLTFLYAVSSAVILLAICTITYLGVARNLESRNNDYINDELNVLLATLQESDGEVDLQQEIKREQAERMHVVHYVRILDGQGRTLLENPQMELILPAAVFPAPSSRAPELEAGIQREARDGNVYNLRSLRAKINGFGGNARVLQIAMDISSLEHFLANFRLKLAATLLIGVALSALAGWIVARRGLLPLEWITATVEEITACRLHERIDPGRWPRELAKLGKAFDSMLGRLEEAFDGLSQYTANLAHELRTPINNLMIEADIALLRERTPEEYQKVIGSSMEEFDRLSRLIDSLLFLARADHAAHELHREPIDVAKKMEDLAEFYRALAADQDVKVICRGEATLSADPVLFRRALGNLVSNGLKYTPQGGEVVVSALQRDDSSVEISVSDTGCGIDPEHLPRIFDRFYRAGAEKRRDIPGYGLGLAIVKAIMALHGGSVEAQSLPSGGTTVTLHFPPQLHS